MRFSRYMHEWLYGSQGYYRHYRPIGKKGDFYTAVSTSAFFGASIANEIYRRIKTNEWDSSTLQIVEIGAHHGYLLADIVRWLYTCDEALIGEITFGIVEPHEHLRHHQKRYFYEQFDDAVVPVHYDTLSQIQHKGRVCFIANEIFDAFGCELYHNGRIATVDDHTLQWIEADEALKAFAQKHHLHKGEIAVGYEEFAQQMGYAAPLIDFLSFDYGERYVRNDFSIRLYQKHKTFPLFDEAVKLQEMFGQCDITYDVHFDHVIEAFKNAEFEVVAYETQARALVRFGIIDILEQYAKQAPIHAYLREADKIKTLLAPTIMGDKFKLLHVAKQI